MENSVLIYEKYILIIDTNKDMTDMFDRFCAFCTGFMDERERSSARKHAESFSLDMNILDNGEIIYEKNPFYGFIIDEEINVFGTSFYSPCSVWPSKMYGKSSSGDYSVIDESNFSEYNSPAPFSVGIFFENKPQSYQVELIKQRSNDFFGMIENGKVEGFRLIVHKKYGEEVAL